MKFRPHFLWTTLLGPLLWGFLSGGNAQADTGVNGFFRADFVRAGVFERDRREPLLRSTDEGEIRQHRGHLSAANSARLAERRVVDLIKKAERGSRNEWDVSDLIGSPR